MHASDAVLSGGVRRSATICIFSPDDQEMATAKTGNWFQENPQRARSNNSAMLLRDKTTREQFMPN
jgi:ribonucleoside-triphosphate reductase